MLQLLHPYSSLLQIKVVASQEAIRIDSTVCEVDIVSVRLFAAALPGQLVVR